MTSCEQALIQLLVELTGAPLPFSSTESFLDQGIDSFVALRLMRGIEDRLGVKLTLDALYDHPSVSELARFIEARTAVAAR